MADLTFFPDSNVDRVLGVVMELAAELHVMRDRLRTVELLLERQGSLTRADLETYLPDEAERNARLDDRDRFIRRVLAPMTDDADSPAPQFEPA